jgi:hypothetical protein
MPCQTCDSVNQREFTADINIHFPGMKGIDIPTVLIHPQVCVCLNCGSANFSVPAAEVNALDHRDWRNQEDRACAQ